MLNAAYFISISNILETVTAVKHYLSQTLQVAAPLVP